MKIRPIFISLLAAVASIAPVCADSFAAGDERPLMVIRFNQENVYYGRALKQAVVNAENAKSGVVYKVVSYIPAGKRKGQVSVSAEQAKKNVAGVTSMMQQLGVDAGRIQQASENSASVSSQEIRIYVE